MAAIKEQKTVGGTFCGKYYCGESVVCDRLSIYVPLETQFKYDPYGRLTGVGDKQISYDDNGRPLNYLGTEIEWNGSRMKKYGSSEYEYDGDNCRLSKTVKGKKRLFFYDVQNALRVERTEEGEIHYLYDASGVRGFEYVEYTVPGAALSRAKYYYEKDLQGNIVGIVNSEGTEIVKYEYVDAWGSFNEYYLTDEGRVVAALNSFTYRGYYYDKESGLYYLINRYYDPTTGRFISPDDVGYLDFESFFGTNRYAYCLDNPVNYIDPEGTFGFWALVAITISAIIIGGSAQVLSNAFAGKTGRDLWRGVAAAAIGSGINALLMCLTAGWSFGLSAAFSGTISALVQTGVDTIETAALGEKIDWGQTGLDLLINTVTATIGNIVGGKIVPTNSKWFQPKHFLSVFRKSYGQKLLMQTVIGGTISGIVNFTRKYIEYGKQYSKRQPKRRSITAIN